MAGPALHHPPAARIRCTAWPGRGPGLCWLAFTNTDARSQPVGLGWPPFFHRRAGSHLQIDLSHRWDSDPLPRLPSHQQPQPGIDADVAQLAFEHCVEGWRGAALIRDEALSMRLSASVPFLVVFTPADKPYFCVEPVSHVDNAIGMTEPAAHGLRDLAAGATLEASFLLEIAPARALPAALT